MQSALSSLLVLRRVCRSFRTKADERIAFHMILRGNELPIEIHSGLLQEKLATISVSNFGAAVRERFPWAPLASVLDVDATKDYKELALLLLSWELKDLKTLRFTKGAPNHVREHLGLPRAERAIYFSADFKPTPDPLTFLRYSLFFSSTVVINKTGPSGAANGPRRYELSPFCWASFLVIIVRKWEAPVTPAGEVQGSLRAALEGNLGETFHILCAAAKGGLPAVIVVGLEQLSPGALGLHAHELGGKTVQESLRALMHAEWEREREHERQMLRQYRGDAPPAYINEKKFRFLTLTTEEYCDAIGEAEFGIETSDEVRYSRAGDRRLHERFFPNSFLF